MLRKEAAQGVHIKALGDRMRGGACEESNRVRAGKLLNALHIAALVACIAPPRPSWRIALLSPYCSCSGLCPCSDCCPVPQYGLLAVFFTCTLLPACRWLWCALCPVRDFPGWGRRRRGRSGRAAEWFSRLSCCFLRQQQQQQQQRRRQRRRQPACRPCPRRGGEANLGEPKPGAWEAMVPSPGGQKHY